MTTYYSVSKCKYFAFVRSEQYISETHSKNIFHYPEFPESTSEHFTLIVNALDDSFRDIVFEIDDKHTGEDSKNIKTQEVTSNAYLGSGNIINSFNKGTFVIIPGKKSASIQKLNQNQNNDVIDALAVNGLLTSPKPMVETSVGQLMNKLAKFESFDIIFVHPNLMTDRIEGIYPSISTVPPFEVGKGEILSVFFRYLCLRFFGYTAIHDETNRETLYDI